MTASERIFVYGSLRNEEPNCPRFLGASKLVGEAVTADRFKLTGFSYVPYAYPDPVKGHQLLGEVWDATPEDAMAVDWLETGAGYEPHEIDVFIDGVQTKATMYINDRSSSDRAHPNEDGCVEWPRYNRRVRT